MFPQISGLVIRKVVVGGYRFDSSDGLFEGEEVGGVLRETEIERIAISIEDSININFRRWYLSMKAYAKCDVAIQYQNCCSSST